jgi:hypothetical protein
MVLCRTPAPVSHPGALGAAGIRRLPRARGMEMVWGLARGPQFGGGSSRTKQARNIIHNTHTHTHTHTHTLVGRLAQLTQALPARRGHLEGHTTDT